MNLGLFGELVFDGRELRVRRGFDQVIHPAVGQERGRGDAGVGGAGMLEGVVLLQKRTQILQKGAAAGGVFEMLDALPCDIQPAISSDRDNASAHRAVANCSSSAGADEGFVGEEQVEGEAARIGCKDAIVERVEISEVRLEVCRKWLYGSVQREERAADMSEPVVLASIEPASKAG